MRAKLILITITSAALSLANPKIQVRLEAVESRALKSESYPTKGLKISKATINHEIFELLAAIAEDLNQNGDTILDEFVELLPKFKSLKVKVVLTSGFPSPYDAWTAKRNGKTAIFFNSDQWSSNNLKRRGLPILKHEVTHAVMDRYFSKIPKKQYVKRLEQVSIDEGIAHFIGQPRRDTILDQPKKNWTEIESEYHQALIKLNDPLIPESEKEAILEKANTGSYWEKFGAMRGLFKAAQIYRNLGTKGLAAVLLRESWEPK